MPLLKATLCSHQRVGVDHMLDVLGRQARQELDGHGLLLCDGMGLGKTVQALAVVCCALEVDPQATVLILCPPSMSDTWLHALMVHTHLGITDVCLATEGSVRPGPDVRVIVTPFSIMKQLVKFGKRQAPTAKNWARWRGNPVDPDVWMLRRDFACVVVDECHAAKSMAGQDWRALFALRRRNPATPFLCMSGTPVQNRHEDLVAMTVLLGFRNKLTNPAWWRRTDAESLEEQASFRTTYIIARDKRVLNLPPQHDHVLDITLGDVETAAYDAVLTDVLKLKDVTNANRMSVMAQLTRLRQCTTDARLAPAGSDMPPDMLPSKMRALGDVLGRHADEAGIIWSQWTSVLRNVSKALTAAHIGHVTYDGSLSADARGDVLTRWANDDSVRVILISLHAGNSGLTLLKATFAVFMDQWFNPSQQLQARDRNHRIGQTKEVHVYTLRGLTADGRRTIDHAVYGMNQSKMDMARGVVLGEVSSDAATTRSLVDTLRAYQRGEDPEETKGAPPTTEETRPMHQRTYESTPKPAPTTPPCTSQPGSDDSDIELEEE